MKDYVPTSEDQVAVWAANFKAQLALANATLNLPIQTVSDLNAKCDSISTLINSATLAKNAYKVKIDEKNTGVADALQVLRNGANFIKANPAYTNGIGQSLGILGTADASIDFTSYKPTITVTAVKGHVVIKFTKKGVEGVNVYARLMGDIAWTFLARDTHSPYDDYRPLAHVGAPETREYQVIGIVNDIEIGIASDVASATFTG